MLLPTFSLALGFFASATFASPIAKRALRNYTTDVEIHQSCNSTQRRMLERALSDTWDVAAFAKEYTLTNGPQDPIFQMYFGYKSEAFSTVVGIWDSLLHSNKEGVLFRCDNIDGNCGQPGWRGHWRGSNATSETVICDLSYTDRLFNTDFCMFGWELTTAPVSTYWSIDLIHRLFHVPVTTNSLVSHYAESYADVLELSEHNSTYSPFDSDTLQYYAAHVYALEVAQGGDACIGPMPEHDHTHDHNDAPTASASASASASTAAAAPSASASKDCHTHADGTVHCV